jgi:uncharacterized protein YabE (DUF348 family)/3D (Asp-Asp-Asp) domain-containing protein
MAATFKAYVIDGEKTIQVEVLGADQTAILRQAEAHGLTPPAQNDIVSYNKDNNTVTIRRAIAVSVTADGATKTTVMHYGDTVQDALKAVNVEMQGNDSVTPSKESKLTADTAVTVGRQQKISITADGKTFSAVVPCGTVQNALTAAGITLGKDDTLSADRNAQVYTGMSICIKRVLYREVKTEKAVAFNTTRQHTSSLELGTTQVQTAGQNGSQMIVTREKLVDGKLNEVKTISIQVTKKPVDQVTLVGTKARPSAYATITSDGILLDQNGNEVHYSKYFTGRCTAYTSNGGYTATGARARYGYVAVNPNVIPYGTKLYICSPDGRTVYGYAIAADTGGFASNGAILSDLYYNTYSDCINFGVRTMRLYVIS